MGRAGLPDLMWIAGWVVASHPNGTVTITSMTTGQPITDEEHAALMARLDAGSRSTVCRFVTQPNPTE